MHEAFLLFTIHVPNLLEQVKAVATVRYGAVPVQEEVNMQTFLAQLYVPHNNHKCSTSSSHVMTKAVTEKQNVAEGNVPILTYSKRSPSNTVSW